MKKTLTIFTPAFNRAHLLPRLYQSLCEQTKQDFIWLIADDGSSDGTDKLVEQWQTEGKIEILYFYKENGGMHTAHNLAYKNMNTELNVCIDSDDWMPVDAVEKILNKWESIENKEKIAGLIGLDAEENGQIIGTKIPEHLTQGSIYNLYQRQSVRGDKKVVLRTDLVKQYPLYPEYPEERLVPLSILYAMISRDYDFVYHNEVYCIVEYQEDGSSGTIFKQYFQSPKGFAYSRLIEKEYSEHPWYSLKSSAHLGVTALITKDFSWLFKKPKVYQNFLMFPVGIILYFYFKAKAK